MKTTPQRQVGFRKQIGPALLLWELLVNLVPGEWDGKSYVFVAGGRIFSDTQLAIWLDVKVSTIAAWRRRLKTAGLLDWTIKPGAGRVYVASPVADKKIFEAGSPRPTPEVKPAASLEVGKADTEPLASRFVQ